MARSWTSEQLAAINTLDRDVCVSAGAGAGKTGVLVERFLTIVRGMTDGSIPPECAATVDRILVVTFTEKATAEMKARIVRALAEGPYEAARRGVESAYISTIHGFCARLIRENPFDAGVDPDFSILSAPAARALLHSAFDRMLNAAFRENDGPVVELACAAQDERVFGAEASDPVAVLRGAVENVMSRARSGSRGVEDIEAAGADVDTRRPGAWLVARAHRAIDALSSAASALSAAPAGALAAAESRRRQVLDCVAALAACEPIVDLDDIGSAAVAAGRISEAVGRAGTRPPPAADPSAFALLDRIAVIATEFRALFEVETEREAEARRHGAALLRLTAQTWREYDRLKDAAGMLDHEDLQTRAVELLRISTDTRRRMADHFRHIMVDEYQDTSPVQAALVALLRAEPPALPNRLFVVGDRRQSIYAFRGADPTLFVREEADCAEVRGGTTIAMCRNFRSRPEIVAFINHLFEGLWRATPAMAQGLEAGADFGQTSAPCIEALISPSARLGGSAEASAVADHIASALDGSVTITDPSSPRVGQPPACRDIAIILRAMSSVERYEDALSARGIPHLTVGGGRAYYARHEVRDVRNLLTVLATPLRDMPLAAVLRSPMAGWSLETLYALMLHVRSQTGGHRGPIYPHLRSFLRTDAPTETERRATVTLLECLEALRIDEDRYTAGQILERLITATGYDRELLARANGRRRHANLRKLLMMAADERESGIASFLARLEDLERVSDREGDAPTEEEGADAVRIVSAHRAKGLEFPVVYLADMARRAITTNQSPFVFEPKTLAVGCRIAAYESLEYRRIEARRPARTLEEETRVLYVAMTRARERLILAGALDRGAESWSGMVFGHLGILRPPSAPEVRRLFGALKIAVRPVSAGP